MSQGIVSKILMKLVPRRFFEQAEDAEAGAEDVKTQLNEVEEKGVYVQSLVSALRADRLENHYADRVRAAYMGRER